ncbi:putative DNA repair protein RadC [Gemella bergeri ATCC 700627]|uniref:Putative DNA repair protein RadC n=1 Tax=Gemella bergeri ATCC 700627 TaxID=1321820 RepID=U2RVK0_9BACL|nr:DNA repair protein RadC [Gemella bergeri]ERK57593.1 putative DNA repair protein RadC [Gemella bergeri ATCC 700627]
MVKGYTIKELEMDERPREKLRTLGATSLSDREILAILLRTGTKEKNVLELATGILKDAGGIRNLREVTFNELTKHKGIGDEKAIHILANIEFARRIYATEQPEVICNNPNVIANYLKSSLENLTQEVFVTLDINTKGKILQQREVFKGSLSVSIIHPREIFKNAIKNSASSVICIHNHPSGDATPSLEDIKTTVNLLEVGEIVGIEMLDHIIIAKTGYVSIRRVLNYLTEENIDYKKEKITQKQLQYIIRKYKIVNKY